MTFIEKNLANNEQIIYRAKLHWWIYGQSVFLLILGIVVFALWGKTEVVKIIGGLLVIIGLITLLNAYIRSSTSEFAVTNRRIMMKTGVTKRRLIELQLNRSDGLVIDQGIIGRIFNYGSIIIRTGNLEEIFSPVADPYEFKRQINNAIEESFAPFVNTPPGANMTGRGQ
ncbi:PH domain-containing protein [Mucilaginibacter sp. BJC16-A38]|uniref:PH domain-containing protein n=1 Tax=Mucilaginibacter phenanthrenivorans TaxID=1234842 RepID=UPI00215769C4|nr:PH domain-containing protein [Mucilaginibacter phenanthrenivorans]MCR8556388.1 PH domain-containing protein [Mucilaginibacter phenanthrenivorans]